MIDFITHITQLIITHNGGKYEKNKDLVENSYNNRYSSNNNDTWIKHCYK